MSVALLGRAIAAVGIVVGLLAVGLPLITSQGFSTRYVDDGTVFAFLVILLSLSSLFPAETGRDLNAAAMGTAAFGLFLFVPAALAFDNLGFLGAGAWLGICTVLIPIGALIVRSTEAKPAAAASPPPVAGPAALAAVVGSVCIVVGIWLPLADGGKSYWNVSHTLGILMLLLALLTVVLVGATLFSTTAAADLALLVAAATFGLVEAEFIGSAFEDFGSLGSGAWLEAVGGLFLLLGVVALRRTAARSAHATVAAPAAPAAS